tara:strand:- start:157 stop:387 length:231 start_codon:yes stop_codon:yes gene_type:complete
LQQHGKSYPPNHTNLARQALLGHRAGGINRLRMQDYARVRLKTISAPLRSIGILICFQRAFDGSRAKELLTIVADG